MPEQWEERITIDPEVCHGKPCVRGTRVMVSILLDYLAAGEAEEEILRQYPSVSAADLRAAREYAAWLAHEEERLPLRTVAVA